MPPCRPLHFTRRSPHGRLVLRCPDPVFSYVPDQSFPVFSYVPDQSFPRRLRLPKDKMRKRQRQDEKEAMKECLLPRPVRGRGPRAWLSAAVEVVTDSWKAKHGCRKAGLASRHRPDTV